jgi:hypothetical protein
MKKTIPVQAAWWVLLVGALTSPWAHATEPVTWAERSPQAASENTLGQIPAGAARSNQKPASSRASSGTGNSPQATAPANAPAAPVRSQRLLSGTHAFPAKPTAGPNAREYLLPKPQTARLAHRSNAAAGTSATTLSANVNRPSGVFGATGRSSASLKPASGNGVVGGPHVPGGGFIGGPSNNRTVIKASIDGSAFHRRS